MDKWCRIWSGSWSQTLRPGSTKSSPCVHRRDARRGCVCSKVDIDQVNMVVICFTIVSTCCRDGLRPAGCAHGAKFYLTLVSQEVLPPCEHHVLRLLHLCQTVTRAKVCPPAAVSCLSDIMRSCDEGLDGCAYLCRCPATRQTQGFCKPPCPKTSTPYMGGTVWGGAGLLQGADQ